jgi:AcrR family transcriptional regulator
MLARLGFYLSIVKIASYRRQDWTVARRRRGWQAASVPKRRKPVGSYHHGDLREALLAEALRVIEHEGLSELSLRDLARRLGVSSAAPYHHFSDRTELLLALARSGFERLETQMRHELLDAGPTAADRLQALGRGYLRFAKQHPSHFRLMFRPDWLPEGKPLHAGHEGVKSGGDKTGDGSFGLLQQVVIECMQEAGTEGEDLMPSVLAMWGGVHGIASLRLDGPLAAFGGVGEVDDLCEQALEALGAGLKARNRSVP